MVGATCKGKILVLGVFFCNFFVFALARGSSSFSQTYEHTVSVEKCVGSTKCIYTWAESAGVPFTEMIVSWNALRPKTGKYVFYARVKSKKWSAWLKCAEWGASCQQSFSSVKDDVARLDIDTISLKNKRLATEFEVKVECCGDAVLDDVHKLYACVSNFDTYVVPKPSGFLKSCCIDGVMQQSQLVLQHPRANDLCSPTATSSSLSFLLQGIVDPVDFSALVYDQGHDIFGNWVLNVAAAYDISGGKVCCHVERLANFERLYGLINNNWPVIVSIQGPLKGSASPYKKGHIMVVIGWDLQKRRVLCIDSAFNANNKTKVWYDGDEFCKAWGRRKNLAYVFAPSASSVLKGC